MIPKTLNEIVEADLAAVITNAVVESKTIDYKRILPGNSDADKKEFLADASSFANTAGGDLIFGMEEAAGLPIQICGVQTADLDAEILRLDALLASGLSPRIRYSTKVVTTASGQRVVVLRVDRSWAGPHRVVLQGHDKFYGRNSAGKYPLDVNELRAAFTLSSTANDRIRAFRTDRIIALSNNETPLPFDDSSKIVVHCIPLEAFVADTKYDFHPLLNNMLLMPPMGTNRWNIRHNLEGILAFGIREVCTAYTQLYRNGIIEAVLGNLLRHQYQDRHVIPSVAYERYILEYLPRCFRLLQEIGAAPPIVVALTLIGTKGLYMGIDTMDGERGYSIDAENVVLPEMTVDSFDVQPGQILKPVFDIVWNACGFLESHNFDAEGNWHPPH